MKAWSCKLTLSEWAINWLFMGGSHGSGGLKHVLKFHFHADEAQLCFKYQSFGDPQPSACLSRVIQALVNAWHASETSPIKKQKW